ncbi:TonB-dependent receptor [uncultured Hyphomonas sp.]|jgi:iron complex outermembrane receptor protein|uniref:TonB-dependent receptor plug domain-containing protein n=1 Tax=uncultured Hyphomonas sp. TaxID=225298 RepID=UPI000C64DA72|nr:TonB-dependent receptor [Hyphomonadaceae bacterium]MBA29808.1 TonB-dependent receptor [Hyphomonadaceae bacterium]|tara:strand:- start:418663 stop:421083 length:2421 start_codon:yes stop_codon:yes gene_type:complete
MTTLRTLLITASSLAVTAASTSAFAQETPDATGSELRQSEVVVTGTRTANRTALETAVPVDVFPVEELTETGRVELNQILSTTVPSFNFNQTAINDGTDIIRPATLRGLSPDQTLVLVNGKRRHITALVNINGSVGRGSAAVDLNSIPTSAIGNVQVLRDGASAQYGSDAIAGVINVILREADHGGGVNIRYGAHVTDPEGLNRSEVDGQTTNVGGWAGFGLGENGFLTVSGEYSLRQRSNRAGIDPRQQFPDDPAYAEAERSFDRLNHVYGNGRMENINFFLNSGYTLNNGVELYAFGGVQEREAESPGFYRRASDSRNVPEIYPGGFLPVIGGDVSDYSLGGGVRGEAGGWDYDVSAVYGSNELDYSVTNSLNASLGPDSQTSFDAGSLAFDQVTLNADIVKTFDNLLPGETSLAFGAEYRDESFEIGAGEEASYIQGPFPAAAGSQVFPGFTPESEVDESRNAASVYGEVEWVPNEKTLISAAVRYEDYSDFGDAVTGKLAGRYDFTDQVAVRGAVATGFRAPSLQQQYFTAISTNFIDGVPFEVGTFPATSPASVALGGGQLDAEESTSFSLGTVLTPTNNWFVTIDAYQINIDDQIFLTENLGGDEVDAVLANAGVTGVQRVRFFQNGIETETKGVDIVTKYAFDFGTLGTLDASAAFNYSKTEVTHVPDNLVIPDLELFSRSNRLTLEESAPETKLILAGNYTYQQADFVLRATRFGEVLAPSNDPANDFTLDADWIIDASVNFNVTDQFSVGVGADNLLDEYPTMTPDGLNFNGIFPYSSRSPYGFAGRFLYMRASYNW